ncbi:hypothetical protein Zmor_011770 [Zophobas morio]|uniref:Acetyl-CoA acetyltransferase, cytosolic n=1 Tax=Zophobas morio TaxID=2755281 RepID=A0AA38HH04_9CUCU|nr:hypothetical protein Zmor_011770 [Zophobas morio]
MEVFILSAVRTPIGSFRGSLAGFSSSDLGAIVIKEALERAKVDPGDVDEVILGQVLTALCGQNPARMASIKAGLPTTVPAYCLNMVCGSGLKAVVLGAQSIICGDAEITVVGGQESMSQAPHAVQMRPGVKMGNTFLTDLMIYDGLTCGIRGIHMGITAENLASKFNVSREEQDQFSLFSQKKAESAQNSGCFKEEIVSVTIKNSKGSEHKFSEDEFIRKGATIEGLAKLRPCFNTKGNGSVTAGNASGINDGAAALVLISKKEAERRQAKPLARLVSWAHAGVDPEVMGVGPIEAVKKALIKAKWTIESVDLFELNEAFAVQSLVVLEELAIDKKKVNVGGGAIALGHPLGASGARILVTLLHSLKRENKTRGVAALCIGGGMGIAVCVEMCI